MRVVYHVIFCRGFETLQVRCVDTCISCKSRFAGRVLWLAYCDNNRCGGWYCCSMCMFILKRKCTYSCRQNDFVAIRCLFFAVLFTHIKIMWSRWWRRIRDEQGSGHSAWLSPRNL